MNKCQEENIALRTIIYNLRNPINFKDSLPGHINRCSDKMI